MASNTPPVNIAEIGSLAVVPLSPNELGTSQGKFLLLSYGTCVCNGATPVTVANANVTSASIIVFTLQTVGGTVSPNAPNVLTITAGTGFTFGGTASDTSTYNYLIIG